MSWLSRFLASSIGKKLLVALSGLGLVGFLFSHLLGNLQLFRGDGAMNEYAHGLHAMGPLLTVAELGLLGLFLLHIVLVIKLTIENKAARGQSYAGKKSRQSGFRYLSSKAMVVTGLVVLTFLVVHIADYRLGRSGSDAALAACLEATGVYANCEGAIGDKVLTSLQVPWRAALYILGSLFIGWHLIHGFQSAIRSLGVNHSKYTPIIEKLGIAIGVLIGVLFAAIPATIILTGGKMPLADEQPAAVEAPADSEGARQPGN